MFSLLRVKNELEFRMAPGPKKTFLSGRFPVSVFSSPSFEDLSRKHLSEIGQGHNIVPDVETPAQRGSL